MFPRAYAGATSAVIVRRMDITQKTVRLYYFIFSTYKATVDAQANTYETVYG